MDNAHDNGDHDQCEFTTCEDLQFNATEYAMGYLEVMENLEVTKVQFIGIDDPTEGNPE